MPLDAQEFMALHRHWMWANIIKKHFEGVAAEVGKVGDKPDGPLLLAGHYGAYMSIWYGMLFGTLEVLKKRDVVIPEIQADIDGIFEGLRKYRNAVFHPQEEYLSPKLFEIMKDPDSVRKIWSVHAGLGGYFLAEFKRRRQE